MRQKIILSWSGGKDSTLALYELQRAGQVEVAALLTTLNGAYDRVSMHGVRRALLEQQAAALGLPLDEILLPEKPDMDEYGAIMARAMEDYRARGITAVAFGDLFLEDVRAYRENNLAQVQMAALFPLWGRDTGALAGEFITAGFRAVVVTADSRKLDASFVGRVFDDSFLRDLPAGIDPCGENGEFHSFVCGGPIFKEMINFTVGETVLRDDFYYCDLLSS